jgi:hypothetical protein
MFRPDVYTKEDFLYIDLDTCLPGRHILDFFTAGRFTGLRDKNPNCFGSGLLFVPAADRPAMWADFTKDPQGNIMKFSQQGKRWDAGFMEKHHGGTAQIWEDFLPGQLVDIRQVRKSGVPDEARMVICHSRPRPWNDPCLKQYYT